MVRIPVVSGAAGADSLAERQRPWIVGGVAALVDAMLVVGAMAVFSGIAGPTLATVYQLLGLAFLDGPGWLTPAIMAGLITTAGMLGARAAHRRGNGLFAAALTGVLTLVALYVAWVFVWTTWRLTMSSGIAAAPFLPLQAALLALAGLVLPGLILFLPAGLLWAWVVSAVLGTVREKPTGE